MGDTLEWADALLQLCSALGLRDVDETTPDVYRKGAECHEVLKDVMRNLRVDVRNSERPVLRQLGQFEFLQKDLLMLLIQYAGDARERQLMITLLRVMTAMTLPAYIVFQYESQGQSLAGLEKTMSYMQVTEYLTKYKEAFVQSYEMTASQEEMDEGKPQHYQCYAPLRALLQLLYDPLTAEERTDRDNMVIELILTLIRNILHAPNPKHAAGSETLHDRAVRAMEESGIIDVIMSMCHDITEYFSFKMIVLEIMMLLYREQTAESLFSCVKETRRPDRSRNLPHATDGVRPSALPRNARSRHAGGAGSSGAGDHRQARKRKYGSRHARFGGSFEVKMAAGAATDTRVVSTAVLRRAEGVSEEGKTHRVAKPVVDAEAVSKHVSPLLVRVCLYKHAVAVVRDCFNSMVPLIEDELRRMELKDLELIHADRKHYLQFIRLFMEFHRLQVEADIRRKRKEGIPISHEQGYPVSVVGACLGQQTVDNIQSFVQEYFEALRQFPVDGKLWGRRLHFAIRAFHELLMYLHLLAGSPSEEQRTSASSMTSRIFYHEEFLNIFPKVVINFNPRKESRELLDDIILTVHGVLKLLSSSTVRLFVRRKKRKGGKRKSRKQRAEREGDQQPGQEGEQGTEEGQQPEQEGEQGSEEGQQPGQEGEQGSEEGQQPEQEGEGEGEQQENASLQGEGDAQEQADKLADASSTAKDNDGNNASVASQAVDGEAMDTGADSRSEEHAAAANTTDANSSRNNDDASINGNDNNTNTNSSNNGGDDGGDDAAGDNQQQKENHASNLESLFDDEDGSTHNQEERTPTRSTDAATTKDLAQELFGDDGKEQQLALREETEDEMQRHEEETRIQEAEFQFSKYLELFKDYRVVRAYCEALRTYVTNSASLNHCIVKMFDRIVRKDKLDARPLFYQLSFLRLFRSIVDDPASRTTPELQALRGFIKVAVVRPLVEELPQNPVLYVELLFSKTAMDVDEIKFGHVEAMRRRKTKTRVWSPEDDKTLRQLYTTYKDDPNMIQHMIEVFEDRSARAIKARLTKLGISITHTKDWSEEEDATLRHLFLRHENDADPVEGILQSDGLPANKLTRSRILARLRKLGIYQRQKYKQASEEWTEEELTALHEVWKECSDLPLLGKLEVLAGDPRLAARRERAIRQKLIALDLIKDRRRKPQQQQQQQQRRRTSTGGDGGDDADDGVRTTRPQRSTRAKDPQYDSSDTDDDGAEDDGGDDDWLTKRQPKGLPGANARAKRARERRARKFASTHADNAEAAEAAEAGTDADHDGDGGVEEGEGGDMGYVRAFRRRRGRGVGSNESATHPASHSPSVSQQRGRRVVARASVDDDDDDDDDFGFSARTSASEAQLGTSAQASSGSHQDAESGGERGEESGITAPTQRPRSGAAAPTRLIMNRILMSDDEDEDEEENDDGKASEQHAGHSVDNATAAAADGDSATASYDAAETAQSAGSSSSPGSASQHKRRSKPLNLMLDDDDDDGDGGNGQGDADDEAADNELEVEPLKPSAASDCEQQYANPRKKAKLAIVDDEDE